MSTFLLSSFPTFLLFSLFIWKYRNNFLSLHINACLTY